MTRSLDQERRIRWLMLGCACCLSIGSHFGANILGPLKTSLHKSESAFSALVSSFELVGTVTPLLSGILVPRFGSARVGLAATGIVALGQAIVCWTQRNQSMDSTGTMVLGLTLFGMGIAPLAVVQESIIRMCKMFQRSRFFHILIPTSTVVRYNSEDSSSVAKSVAAALLLGKTSSFAAALLAQPLASVDPRLPFLTSLALSIVSLAACILYAWLESRHLLDEDRNSSQQKTRRQHQSKSHLLTFKEVCCFGDGFFAYLAVCTLAGSWYVTMHLSSSFLQTIYGIDESHAGTAASLIQFTSIVLYPALGWVIDKEPSVLPTFFFVIPILCEATFAILLALSGIVPYLLSIVPAAIGIGGGPLLLVLIVPRVVHPHEVPTALGLHKSVEMAGAVLCQYGAADLMARSANKTSERKGSLSAVAMLLCVTIIQSAVIFAWWHFIGSPVKKETMEPAHYEMLATNDERETEQFHHEAFTSKPQLKLDTVQYKRGRMSLYVVFILLLSAWVVFLVKLP